MWKYCQGGFFSRLTYGEPKIKAINVIIWCIPFSAGLHFLTCLKLSAVPLTSTVVIFPNYSLLRLTMAELLFTKSHLTLCDSMN